MPPPEDKWTVAQGEDNGLPLIIRIRNQRPPGVDSTTYPHLIAVSWAYEPNNESGMPSSEEAALMTQFEELLDPALEAPQSAFLTVIVTGNGVREWLWYSRDPGETMALVNQALTGYAPMPVQFSNQQDPDWQAYARFQNFTGT